LKYTVAVRNVIKSGECVLKKSCPQVQGPALF
jgi:hypothetical protein